MPRAAAARHCTKVRKPVHTHKRECARRALSRARAPLPLDHETKSVCRCSNSGHAQKSKSAVRLQSRNCYAKVMRREGMLLACL